MWAQEPERFVGLVEEFLAAWGGSWRRWEPMGAGGSLSPPPR
ncbi:hypothetical protein PUR71_36420 [Streptomyces sp. SP17BM10]|nr:hypothetical protein [Streptomyces sp. SP17BM10]MEE1788344.1 hypothetical protein [Streptomyces sp. SP17BM10]